MRKNCLNCGMAVSHNFCSNCGQKTSVTRVDAMEIVEETIHFFTHLEKNFLQTSINMILRPGVVQHNYLDGKRKRYQSPLSFFLTWVTVEWLVKSWVIWRFNYQTTLNPKISSDYGAATIYIRNHTYFLLIIIVPVVCTIGYFIMSKPKYNYCETLILCFYSYGAYHILEMVLSTLLLGVVFNGNIVSWQVAYVNLFIGGIWTSWNIYCFYKTARIKYFWIRLILCALLIDYTVYYIIVFIPIIWTHLSN